VPVRTPARDAYHARARSRAIKEEKTMKLVRACFVALAVLLPTAWTLAHADDMKEGEKPAETKKEGKKKKEKAKKDDKKDDKMGDMKMDK
jgi:hypothetical protein